MPNKENDAAQATDRTVAATLTQTIVQSYGKLRPSGDVTAEMIVVLDIYGLVLKHVRQERQEGKETEPYHPDLP